MMTIVTCAVAQTTDINNDDQDDDDGSNVSEEVENASSDEQSGNDDDADVDVDNDDDGSNDDEYSDAEDALAGRDLGEAIGGNGGSADNGTVDHASNGTTHLASAGQTQTKPRKTNLKLQIKLEREKRQTRRVELQIERAKLESSRSNGVMQDDAGIRNSSGTTDAANLKSLLPMMNDADVLKFFMTFERVCELNTVDRSMWARLLTPQLTPQAMNVFLKLSNQEAKSYDSAKRSILAYYKLSAQDI